MGGALKFKGFLDLLNGWMGAFTFVPYIGTVAVCCGSVLVLCLYCTLLNMKSVILLHGALTTQCRASSFSSAVERFLPLFFYVNIDLSG